MAASEASGFLRVTAASRPRPASMHLALAMCLLRTVCIVCRPPKQTMLSLMGSLAANCRRRPQAADPHLTLQLSRTCLKRSLFTWQRTASAIVRSRHFDYTVEVARFSGTVLEMALYQASRGDNHQKRPSLQSR